MIETIQYGIKSVGHETPDGQRKLVAPSAELRTVFETWLDEITKQGHSYESAVTLVRDIKKVSAAEAHELIPSYLGNKNVRHIGYFLSAVYNFACVDDVIIFDLDLDDFVIDGLAMALARNKTFVNKASTANTVGDRAKGHLINYGRIWNTFGWDSRGGLLNYGAVVSGKPHFVKSSMDGTKLTSVAINLGTVTIFNVHDGLGINYGKTEDFGGTNLSREGIAIQAGDALSFAIGSSGNALCVKASSQQMTNSDGHHAVNKDLFFTFETCQQMPRLLEYVESLRQKAEAGRTDINVAIQFLKEHTRDKIEDELEEIVRSYGHPW